MHKTIAHDILYVPVFAVGRHGLAWDEAHPAEVAAGRGKARWRCVDGCLHARGLGEFRSEAEIEGAWQSKVEAMVAERNNHLQ